MSPWSVTLKVFGMIWTTRKVNGQPKLCKTGTNNSDDFFSRLLVGIIQLGTFPMIEQQLEYVTVDYVLDALIHIASDNKNIGKSYSLLSSDVRHSVDVMGTCAYDVKLIPYEDWVEQLKKAAVRRALDALDTYVPGEGVRPADSLGGNVIVKSYSTALVLEDDADWDVNIKAQLREFARGLHALKGNKKVSKQAPYGTDWDLLWIGGCASGPHANETQFYAIPDDPTVPRVKRRGTWLGPLDSWKDVFPEDSTRFIYRAQEGCCTYGYAVSLRGAKKILTALAIDHIEAPVDNAMSELCGGLGDRERIECFAPFPNLIGTYRPAGPAYKDSDINSGDQSLHEEQAYGLVYSTRRNIHRLISDTETVFSQWGEESPWSPGEVNPKELVYPRGYHFH
ncbi:hypothetical protein PENCOP_c006G01735 [Penicillium coprophilum]|uniref:Uncharacterized protein n=1 Tax=Penicillium coprophilum TaxID=36646 RepID=A0A1V6UN35_9EURO|nr:hypothetical protein PENCOP_c006G01735 [Penicillium coprophilum]